MHGPCTQTHKAFIQMAKRLEWTLGHNECCSAPSPGSVPAWGFPEAQNKQTEKALKGFCAKVWNPYCSDHLAVSV